MQLTALILGFAGSMHCLGMCSPLVLAVTNMTPSALVNRIVYNAGRIATYALMGALVAGAGLILPLHKFQNIISIGLGIILLLIAFGGIQTLRIPGLTPAALKISNTLKTLFAKRLKKKTRRAIFSLGALNGLLPCGLTLIALAWCLTLKGPLDGLNFMLLFGLGTLPVMLGFTGALPWLVKKFNWSIQKLTTSMLIVSGCVLIARVFIIHAPHTAVSKRGIIEIFLCQ